MSNDSYEFFCKLAEDKIAALESSYDIIVSQSSGIPADVLNDVLLPINDRVTDIYKHLDWLNSVNQTGHTDLSLSRPQSPQPVVSDSTFVTPLILEMEEFITKADHIKVTPYYARFLDPDVVISNGDAICMRKFICDGYFCIADIAQYFRITQRQVSKELAYITKKYPNRPKYTSSPVYKKSQEQAAFIRNQNRVSNSIFKTT